MAGIPKKIIWVPINNFVKLYGISHSRAIARNVHWKEKTKSAPRLYDMRDLLEKCEDIIAKELFDKLDFEADLDEEGSGTASSFRDQKTEQEIRKLRILNDKAEGTLVEASEVAEVYERGLRALGDVLDGVCSNIKKEQPDIDAAVLDLVQRKLVEARRSAAQIDMETFSGEGS